MNLRSKLILQNIIIIAVTVLVTALSCLIAVFIYSNFSEESADILKSEPIVIVTRKNAPSYSVPNMSDYNIRSILMEYEVSQKTINFDDAQYNGKKSEPDSNTTVYTFVPVAEVSNIYRKLALFLLIAFLLAFGVASSCVSKYNQKNIVKPVARLRKDTQRLRDGNLDIPINSDGIGEISELCDCVEELRIKLKESVRYREKAEDNRKFLISGISHDLRTPVTAVRGYIEGITDGIADTEEKRNNYLGAAIKKLDSISEMIDDLLLYSKLDLNKIPFDIAKINITQYMQESFNDSLSDYTKESKNLEFESKISKDICVMIDSIRFKRVIQNIIGNSLKNITEMSGVTKIILRENLNSVIIEIQDNGSGIKKEDLAHIFDRFYRGDASRKVTGSSGLGLTISKQIVEGLGGRIWAISDGKSGTSIMISLGKC